MGFCQQGENIIGMNFCKEAYLSYSKHLIAVMPNNGGTVKYWMLLINTSGIFVCYFYFYLLINLCVGKPFFISPYTESILSIY